MNAISFKYKGGAIKKVKSMLSLLAIRNEKFMAPSFLVEIRSRSQIVEVIKLNRIINWIIDCKLSSFFLKNF